MVINDRPASGEPATPATPATSATSATSATPATSVASKRAPLPSPGSALRKRSRRDAPPVVFKHIGASARNVSLRDCEREQMIDNKIVPRIDVLWFTHRNFYEDVNSITSFASKFDEDYLSTDLHVSEWGKLLRLRENGVATQCCVNDIVIIGAKQPGGQTGSIYQACDRCIRSKRLCARLVQDDDDGVIKLRFSNLPDKYRGDALWHSLDFWVCK